MVSIIIPILNEENNIIKLIDNLQNLKGIFEVIFVDGGSTDNTTKIIGTKYNVIKSKKGRSFQMNEGVKHSKYDILFFLHADSIIDENSILKIEKSMQKNDVGCLEIDFISDRLIMKICSFMSKMRVKYRNIAFGDQGIFIKKELFENLGRFEEIPIMEDYKLSMDIKKLGIKIDMIDAKIYTSDRRFKKNGYIKTMYNMQKYQYLYRNYENKSFDMFEY